MLRCTILVVLLAGLAFAATEDDNSTSTTPIPSTSPTTVGVQVGGNQTKEAPGKGYGHEGGRRYNGRHKDHDYYHRDEIVSPFPDVKSYFDTHYCSVHGSFALSFNEKVEDDQSYGQSGGYGGQPSGGYGNQGGSYGQGGDQYGGSSGGYGQPNGYGGQNNGGYGSQDGGYGGNGYSERKETKFIRKVTRQYCRYTASWSDKACKFCCRVVARSAYTNPDDITAAIFSFDPANPAAGGAGIEIPKHHDSSPAPSYGAPPQQSYGQDGGYGNQGGQYGGNSGDYQQGGQGGYEQQNGGGNYAQQSQQYGTAPPPPPTYQQPPVAPPSPAYGGNGNPQYRSKRSNGYPAPPVEQYGAPEAQSYDTPGGYENQPTYDVEESKGVNQCVCCAPKHRYY